jgi:hypothetical protein
MCVQELNQIFGDSDRPATFADTLQMKYLERCLLETLRMYPPVPVIARKLQEDVKLGNTNASINSIYNKLCALIAPIIETTVFSPLPPLGRDSVLTDIYRLFKGTCYFHLRRLRGSSGSHAGLWFPSSRVQTLPKPLDFSVHKNPQHAFLRRGS